MNGPELSSSIIQKFRQERLASVSPIIDQCSTISVSQRWDVLFQCSIAPKPEWIPAELLATMLDVYQVPSYEHLLPKYLGHGEQWGAIVSPRVATTTGGPIAFIEHWFVTEPTDLEQVIGAVNTRWPLPFNSIGISMSPQHRCHSFMEKWSGVQQEEFVYVANWRESRPVAPLPAALNLQSCLNNHEIHFWWQDLCQALNVGNDSNLSAYDQEQLHIEMESCIKSGGILNFYDHQGLVAHISWRQSSDAELLIPQTWNVHYIFVRHDLRSQGLAKHLYGLASEHMALNNLPLVCARVHAKNTGSWKSLESIGSERVMEYYKVG